MLQGLPEEFGWLLGSPSEWCQGIRTGHVCLEVEEMSQYRTTLRLSSVVVGKGQWAWEHRFPHAAQSATAAGLAPVFLWSPIHLFSYRSRQTDVQEVEGC